MDPKSPHPWRATVLTLFPDAFPGVLSASVIGSAEKNDIWQLETVDRCSYRECGPKWPTADLSDPPGQAFDTKTC